MNLPLKFALELDAERQAGPAPLGKGERSRPYTRKFVDEGPVDKIKNGSDGMANKPPEDSVTPELVLRCA